MKSTVKICIVATLLGILFPCLFLYSSSQIATGFRNESAYFDKADGFDAKAAEWKDAADVWEKSRQLDKQSMDMDSDDLAQIDLRDQLLKLPIHQQEQNPKYFSLITVSGKRSDCLAALNIVTKAEREHSTKAMICIRNQQENLQSAAEQRALAANERDRIIFYQQIHTTGLVLGMLSLILFILAWIIYKPA